MPFARLEAFAVRRPKLLSLQVVYALLMVLSIAWQATVAAQEPAGAKQSDPPKASRTIPSGIGGMAWLDDQHLLVVHDTKVGSEGPRVGVLQISSSGTPRYREAVTDWTAAGGESNDLEALAPIPGKQGEFLALESGYYKGQFGRLIRLRAKVDKDEICRVETISAWKLPLDTVSLEGLVCLTRGEGKLAIIVGERGGEVTAEHTSGKLRWTDINLESPGELKFSEKSEFTLRIPAVGWSNPKSVRGCADLYVDAKQQLWCAAAEDPGDPGPFRSVVYLIGTVDPKADLLVAGVSKVAAHWTFDGAKVEAIAAPLKGVGTLSVATDDENYGAMWRPIGPPETK